MGRAPLDTWKESSDEWFYINRGGGGPVNAVILESTLTCTECGATPKQGPCPRLLRHSAVSTHL